AAVHCIEMALDFRQQFARDVVVDIVCYRKYGHNEGDEPSFTQPRLYAAIAKQPVVSEVFLKSLIKEDVIDHEEAQSLRHRQAAAGQRGVSQVIDRGGRN
ncbi:MAG: hypothetical protein CMO48_05895, partial [Verrucomicrobiales bacterium]|nr:hypothetical protein [Verrucomicrobiales bacterium]